MNINYAIELTVEGSSYSSDTIGIKTGVIRWVTGTPGYDSITVVPTWETALGGGNINQVWYEGILISVSNPNRRIDLLMGGNYGTVSGLTIKLQNTMQFWNELESNDLSIINCVVKMYVVIDDVFYSAWQGVVSDYSYNQLSATIKCESNYRKVHKTLPQNTITKSEFPHVSESIKGKPIPICLGRIPYAKLYNVGGNSTRKPLGYNSDNNELLYYCALDNYTEGTQISVITTGRLIEANEWTGYFLHLVAGTDTDNEQDKLVQIKGNLKSTLVTSPFTYYSTILYIEYSYDTTESTVQSHRYLTNYENNSEDIWWFEILSNDCRFIASNNLVNEFVKDDYGNIILYDYNKEKGVFNDVHGLIQNSKTLDRNYLELINSNTNESQTVNISTSHGCSCSAYNDVAATSYSLTNPEYLNDLDRSTNEDIMIISNATISSTAAAYNYVTFTLDFSGLDLRGIEELYIGVDFKATVRKLLTDNVDFEAGFKLLIKDCFENTEQTIIQEVGDGADYLYRQSVNLSGGPQDIEYNFLPNDYYKGPGDDNNETSIFSENDYQDEQVRNYLKLSGDIIDQFVNNLNHKIKIVLWFKASATCYLDNIYMKQIGVFTNKEIETGSENLLCRVGGEKFGAELTRFPRHALGHILETYDGISSSDVDYGNVETTRSTGHDWIVGNQITNQKNSLEYIRDLCKFTMVGAFQNRLGKLKFSAWLEDTSLQKAFDETNTVKNDKKQMGKTPILNCYNEFNLQWGRNPVTNEYSSNLKISKVGELSAFPDYYEADDGSAESSVTLTNFVVGSFDGDDEGHLQFSVDMSATFSVGDGVSIEFTTGEAIFFGEIFKMTDNGVDEYNIYFKNINNHTFAAPSWGFNSALISNMYQHDTSTPNWNTCVNVNSYSLASELWGYCKESYDNTRVVRAYPELKSDWFVDAEAWDGSEVDYQSTPVIFLKKLIQWTTIQRDIKSIEIPITTDNIVLDLLQYVTYSDGIITLDTAKEGRIVKWQLNTNKNTITLDLLLNSEYMYDVDGVIIETGSNTDTIEESGSQPDEIHEGGT